MSPMTRPDPTNHQAANKAAYDFKGAVMAAGVQRISQRKYQAWCPQCSDGLNTSRQVDAHIWASGHNRENHTEGGKK